MCNLENQKLLSCGQAKTIDMVSYLSELGHQPAKIRNVNYWYLSPLRNEKTPSFKVNQKLNRWYDHGIGIGGNLIDFGILYHGCSVTELLQMLSGNLPFQNQNILSTSQADKEEKIVIIQEAQLANPQLLLYLEKRKISFQIASQYCVEVHYLVNGKMFFAIGLKNDSGGYELRNSYFKGSSSPKDVTSIQNGCSNVLVFEGKFDFLAYQTWCEKVTPFRQGLDCDGCDYVILNSLAFFERARLFMEQHESIYLYLDRDLAGHNCSLYAVSLSDKYLDGSARYKGYKDLSQWFELDGYRNA